MRIARIIIASIASAALIAGSSAAAAAAPAVQAAQAQAPSPWAILTANSVPAVALGGATTAAQPNDDSPPPPPAYAGIGINGEVVGLLLWFALIAIALLVVDDGDDQPESPA